jgi:2-methylisocitrate lyase-like PEP mutase family enzyme
VSTHAQVSGQGAPGERAERFRRLHDGSTPLLMPNPWDVGSAVLLESLGFEALATTSSGYAATLGRLDGSITRDEALAHARAVVEATSVPVSADLENCFADDPSGVADTVTMAVRAGVAGCSVEDFTGDKGAPIYDASVAEARVRAAADAAHDGPVRIVLTARAENYVHGRPDLDDTIDRLQRYQGAGADVLFAPGVTKLEDVRRVVDAVDVPVSVLALPGSPTVAELAEVGVRRISVGGAFAFAALGAVVEAARELQDHGTFGYWTLAMPGATAARAAFRSRSD